MKPLSQLPTSALGRAWSVGRVAARLGQRALTQLVTTTDDTAIGEAIAAELDGMKGLAMKVGQILSSLDAGLSPELTGALTRLQRGARPLDAGVVIDALERSLGQPVGAAFDRFDREPVASASIGQVHRAALDGQELAVKVLYPGVAASLEGDFSRLRGVAGLASLATAVDGPALVEELHHHLLEECDYRREAAWQMAVAPVLRALPGLDVPDVLAKRSTASVLTTAWVDGVSLSALSGGSDAATAAAALARLLWVPLLSHGFLHADPHPGNYLFAHGRLVVLDWGCVRRVSRAEVDGLRALMHAVAADDASALREALTRSGIAPDPAHYDFAEGAQMYRWLFAPWLQPGFRFTPAWSEAGRRFSAPGAPNQRQMGFPPIWIWLMRSLFGLHASLARLDAPVDLAAIWREADARPWAPIADPTSPAG